MSNIEELKNETNIGTGKMVLLTLATAGLFPLLWLWRHQPAIDRITGAKTANDTYLLWLVGCFGYAGLLAGTPADEVSVVSVLVLLLQIAYAVLYIVWAFKAKTALQDYAARAHGLDLRMNAFYTLIFSYFYINYCINDLPEAKKRQLALAGHLQGVQPAIPQAENKVPESQAPSNVSEP